MEFTENCRKITEDEIKSRMREKNNLTYTMKSKLATAAQDFEMVMANPLGVSIP